ncbi:MAG: peptidase T, partial [Gemmataceae bacterium]
AKTNSLLEGFLRYVVVNTQADDKATEYPSSPGQRVLGKILCDELRALGLTDALQNEHGLVFATIPGNVPGAPTIAFNSHVDTSPETSGANVRPQIHLNYDGGDIVLPGDRTKILRPADAPELAALRGKTIITTDGTTLLGGDDKAGVAVIMELARRLTANPAIPHGPVRIVFTCDEEVGRGVKHLEPAQIGAVVAYTLDGQGVGEIECETFSADRATVTITGINTHPGMATGVMVNAIRIAAAFIDRLPQKMLTPETTSDRGGFLHPYILEAGVAQATIQILLRDFETAKLAEYATLLNAIATSVRAEYPGATISVNVQEQYRNMHDGIAKEPRALAYALEAFRRAGITPRQTIIRGGTDGALLTAKGLPTPNLSTGEHNIHSPLEWVCVEEMEQCVAMLVELVQVWASPV